MPMQIEDVKSMLQDAIKAVKAASASSQEAARKIEQKAHNPELKTLLQQGSTHAEAWHDRLATAAERLCGAQYTAQNTPAVDAAPPVDGEMINSNSQQTVRDLGIIAGGQLTMHYYIAAFGTMAAYANMLDMPDVAAAIRACLQEAKQSDAQYTELAAKIAT